MGESATPSRAAGWVPGSLRRQGEYGYRDGSDWRPDVSAAMNRMRTSWKLGIRRGATVRIGEFLLKDETVERIGHRHQRAECACRLVRLLGFEEAAKAPRIHDLSTGGRAQRRQRGGTCPIQREVSILIAAHCGDRVH
jgi:hypothetical protein